MNRQCFRSSSKTRHWLRCRLIISLETGEVLASDIEKLWRESGELAAYVRLAMAALRLAEPFLAAGDQAGWLAFAGNLKATGAHP